MSHSKQRHEKVCLNCGTQLYDRYCHKCGQENAEPKQSLWHLIVHVFNDITHFDGKFFATMKMLLFRPGFLSKEWVNGRRVSYLDPIRMYLFISTIFFVVMLSIISQPEQTAANDWDRRNVVDSMRKAGYEDDFTFYNNDIKGEEDVFILNTFEEYRHGYAYYDSMMSVKGEHPGWWDRYLAKRQIATYEVYEKDPYNFIPKFINKVIHSLSKAYFISMPFFAFFLWLLYLRRKQQFYYVSHAIFAIHFYTVSFIFMLLMACLLFLLQDVFFIGLTIMFTIMGLAGYLYVAMLRFYQQGMVKTGIKYLLLAVATTILFIVLAVALLISSFFYLSAH